VSLATRTRPSTRPYAGRREKGDNAVASVRPFRPKGALARARAATRGVVLEIQRLPLPRVLYALIFWLCGIGVIMVLGASAYDSMAVYGSVWSIFEREIIWLAVSLVALVVATRMDVATWRRYRVLIMAATVLMLIAVLVPGVGVRAGGSARWIGVGQLRVQPSEIMKLAFSVFGADLVARRAAKASEARKVVAPLFLVLAFVGALVLVQPDMGTALVLGCIGFGLLAASGVSAKAVGKVLAWLAAISAVVALVDPYRRARLLSFVNPFAHASGSGYQVVQSLVGLGSGHLTGAGIGAGHQVWGLLPNAQTDFIFSVIGEQTGLVGAAIVLGSFAALGWVGMKVAMRARSSYECYLAVAVTCWLVSQAVINIGAVIGVLPVTGIPLPFISFGGSAMVVEMAGAGILVRIAKNAQGRLGASATWEARSSSARSGPLARGPAKGPKSA